MACDKNETELLAALKKGDETAFNCIYKAYSPRLFTNVLRMIKSEAIAQEMIQLIFIKLWSKRHLVDAQKPFAPYLFRIAENTVSDFFRKASRDKMLKKELLLNACELYLHIEEQLYTKENIFIIRQAIDKLPTQRKRIFELCKIEGYSYEEVSNMLSISVSTISDHIVKANHYIRDFLLNKSEFYLTAVLAILLH